MIKFCKVFPFITSVCMLFGIVFHANAADHAGGMNVPSIKSDAVLKGLENPWDMAFLPDGTMFFTEKCKGLAVRTSGGSVNKL